METTFLYPRAIHHSVARSKSIYLILQEFVYCSSPLHHITIKPCGKVRKPRTTEGHICRLVVPKSLDDWVQKIVYTGFHTPPVFTGASCEVTNSSSTMSRALRMEGWLRGLRGIPRTIKRHRHPLAAARGHKYCDLVVHCILRFGEFRMTIVYTTLQTANSTSTATGAGKLVGVG
jgi:hypothetical protein